MKRIHVFNNVEMRFGLRKYRFDDVKHTCAMTNICVFDNANARIR